MYARVIPVCDLLILTSGHRDTIMDEAHRRGTPACLVSDSCPTVEVHLLRHVIRQPFLCYLIDVFTVFTDSDDFQHSFLLQNGEGFFEQAESYWVKLVVVFHYLRLPTPCSSADGYGFAGSYTQAKRKASHEVSKYDRRLNICMSVS